MWCLAIYGSNTRVFNVSLELPAACPRGSLAVQLHLDLPPHGVAPPQLHLVEQVPELCGLGSLVSELVQLPGSKGALVVLSLVTAVMDAPMTPLLLARAIAAACFAALVTAGALLHRRLGARARVEEAEALLAAEFARLETPESGIVSAWRASSSSTTTPRSSTR